MLLTKIHRRWRMEVPGSQQGEKGKKGGGVETLKHHIQDSLRGSLLVLSLPWPLRMGQANSCHYLRNTEGRTRRDYLGPCWQLRIPRDMVRYCIRKPQSQSQGCWHSAALLYDVRQSTCKASTEGSFPRDTLASRMLPVAIPTPASESQGDCFPAQAPQVLQKKEFKSKT